LGREEEAVVRAKSIRLLTVLAFGLMVAGCDKCGDWFWNSRGEGQSTNDACRGTAPKPQ
jgi:hypothetical protein